MQRLDKILSEAGCGSRSRLRAAIRAGRVTVNGQTVRDETRKFDEKDAVVLFDGEPVELRRQMLLLLNKPLGYVTSTDDPRSPTVMELLPAKYAAFGIAPAGRLDKQTEGLLLLTNDGDLAHRIISPRRGVIKTYHCSHEGNAAQADIAAFAAGLPLEDGTVCLPAVLQPLGPGESLVFVQEGKYHQVRRMMAARGMPLSALRRLAEGALGLDGLAPGQWRELDLAAAEQALGKMLELLPAENYEIFLKKTPSFWLK